MKRRIILFNLLFAYMLSFGQDKPAGGLQPYSREITADFLSSYYQQDGNNAAVTGGIGTEELKDFANVLIVNIPLDSVNAVNLYGGFDYYSSASTDNIDNNVSSASSSDVRSFGTLTYSRLNLNRGETYSAKAGFSVEYDYTSFSTGLSYTKEWNESNSEISVSGQAFFDQWQLIYPVELRGRVDLGNAGRQSFNGQVTFSQILNRRNQISLSGEVIYMKGLLSTPFHRVYFSDAASHDVERLPDSRVKIPVSVRWNYYPTDFLVLRTYYRYYWDDFGINANTIELEAPVKVGKVWTVAPFYRFHEQTASDYFAPYASHFSLNNYYTSDYDLSALSSHMYGVEIKYFPLFGLARSKPFLSGKRVFMIKYLELRAGYYTRSTGLNSFIGSIGVGFSIK